MIVRQSSKGVGVRTGARRAMVMFVIVGGIAGYEVVVAAVNVFGIVDTRWLTLPFRAAIFIASFYVIGVYGLVRRQLSVGPAFFLFCAFMWIYGARLLFWSLGTPGRATLRPSWEYPVYFTGVVVVPSIALFVRPRLCELSKAIPIISALLAAMIISTFVTGEQQFQMWSESRLTARGLNPITVGHGGATVTLLAVFYLVRGNRRRTWNSRRTWRSLLALTAIAVGLVALILARSRGPVISLTAGLAILVVRLARGRTAVTMGVLVTGLGLCLSIVAWPVLDEFFSDAVSKWRSDIYGIENRLETWSYAWERFGEAPLLGSTLEVGERRRYPHNIVLESLLASGVVGTAFFAGYAATVVVHARRIFQASLTYFWPVLLAVQFAVGSLFSGAIYSSTGLWYCSAIIVGTSVALAGRPRNRVEDAWRYRS